MAKELLDKRLAEILPTEEYLSLKARAESAFASIQAKAPADVAADVADLIHILRRIANSSTTASAKATPAGPRAPWQPWHEISAQPRKSNGVPAVVFFRPAARRRHGQAAGRPEFKQPLEKTLLATLDRR